jgi:uncharacterized membrane protein
MWSAFSASVSYARLHYSRVMQASSEHVQCHRAQYQDCSQTFTLYMSERVLVKLASKDKTLSERTSFASASNVECHIGNTAHQLFNERK